MSGSNSSAIACWAWWSRSCLAPVSRRGRGGADAAPCCAGAPRGPGRRRHARSACGDHRRLSPGEPQADRAAELLATCEAVIRRSISTTRLRSGGAAVVTAVGGAAGRQRSPAATAQDGSSRNGRRDAASPLPVYRQSSPRGSAHEPVFTGRGQGRHARRRSASGQHANATPRGPRPPLIARLAPSHERAGHERAHARRLRRGHRRAQRRQVDAGQRAGRLEGLDRLAQGADHAHAGARHRHDDLRGRAAQIVLVDTPGIFRIAKRRLERAMVAAAWQGAADADLVVLVVDAERGVGAETRGDRRARSRNSARRASSILNKIDLVRRENLLALTAELNASCPSSATFMMSALKQDGVEDVLTTLRGGAAREPLALSRGPGGRPAAPPLGGRGARASRSSCSSTRNCPMRPPSRPKSGKSATTAACASSRPSTSSATASAPSCSARAAPASSRSALAPATSSARCSSARCTCSCT